MNADAKLARDLAAMIAGAGLILATYTLLGPVAALAVTLFGGALVCVLLTLAHTLDGTPTATDEWCSMVDQQLDQELAARRALRTQHTVMAEVIPLSSRRRGDAA